MTRIGADTATTPFQRVARDLLESNPDATPLDLATSLDFLISDGDDTHPNWHPSSKPFDAMVRLFHFAFGILLYNMWRLIDFLIQLSIDEVEVRTKPRLKAKRFINAVKSRKLLA